MTGRCVKPNWSSVLKRQALLAFLEIRLKGADTYNTNTHKHEWKNDDEFVTHPSEFVMLSTGLDEDTSVEARILRDGRKYFSDDDLCLIFALYFDLAMKGTPVKWKVKLRNGAGYWSPTAEDLKSARVYEEFGYYGLRDEDEVEKEDLRYKTLEPNPSAGTVEFDPSNEEQAAEVCQQLLDDIKSYHLEKYGFYKTWIENRFPSRIGDGKARIEYDETRDGNPPIEDDVSETASLTDSIPVGTSPSKSRSNSVDATGSAEISNIDWSNNAQKDAGFQHIQAAEEVESPGCGARLMKRIAKTRKAAANVWRSVAARAGSLLAGILHPSYRRRLDEESGLDEKSG